MTAPTFRSVCQFTGTIAEAAEAIDALTTQRDDARAELDNMVNLALEVGRLAAYLKNALADRDEYREQVDEWREKYHAAQCRMDEMAERVRELEGGVE